MQIVINIPDEIWNKAKEYGHLDLCGIELSERVINGTPLPKNHGDLIDKNELLTMTNSYKSELGRLKVDPIVKCGIETVESFITDLLPIIEADRSDAE